MHQLPSPNAVRQLKSNRFVWIYQDGDEHNGSGRYTADIYDLSVKDEFGSPLCVAIGVDADMVDKCWDEYQPNRSYMSEMDDSAALGGFSSRT